jgi:D-alanyl-D-alanine carboxypeptidase (penicillin-binding protein 5/6)
LLTAALLAALAPAPAPAQAPGEPGRPDGPPQVSAKAWAIADGATGKVLWGFKEAEPRAIASTTKVMTACVVLRLAVDDPKVLDDIVTFSERADATTGSSARLRAGERLSVRELLYGLMLPSGNDAAVALAEHFGPRFPADEQSNGDPVRRFVAEMNRRAGALNLKETTFVDPNGLGRNQSSARDLAALTWHALRDERFRAYVGTRQHECEVAGPDGAKRAVTWRNTNRLLGEDGYDGVKTGTTRAAGACLIASGRRGPDHRIVAVLGSGTSDGRYTDARALFDWAWRQRDGRPARPGTPGR